MLSTYCVVPQSFDKSRVNEATHLEVTGVDLRLDDAGSKLLDLVCMSRELALSQRYHSRQVHWFVGYTIETLSQYTHHSKPIILYLVCQAVIIADDVAWQEERRAVT